MRKNNYKINEFFKVCLEWFEKVLKIRMDITLSNEGSGY